jgi:hypothetical protein
MTPSMTPNENEPEQAEGVPPQREPRSQDEAAGKPDSGRPDGPWPWPSMGIDLAGKNEAPTPPETGGEPL